MVSFRQLLLAIIAATLFGVPLVFCMQTYQVFEINKFVFFVLMNFLLLFLLTGAILFQREKKFFIALNRQQQIFILLFSIFLLFAAVSTIQGYDVLRSFWGSGNRHFGIFFILHLLLWCGVIFAVKPHTEEQKRYILYPILVAGIVQAMIAFVQYFAPDLFFSSLQTEAYIGRSFGTMGQPNVLAQFLIFPFFISGYFFLREKKWCFFFAALFLFMGILTTQSRAVLFAITVVGCLWSCYFVITKKEKSLFIKTLKLIIIFILVYILYSILQAFFDLRPTSFLFRMEIWQTTANIIADHFWWGIGLENLSEVMSMYVNGDFTALEPHSGMPDRAHNLFLDIMVHTGFFGFFMTIALGIFLIRFFWQRRSDLLLVTIGLALLVLVLAWQWSFPTIVDSILCATFLTIALLPDHTVSRLRISHRLSLLIGVIAGLSIWGSLFLWQAERDLYVAEKNNDAVLQKAVFKKIPWDERF